MSTGLSTRIFAGFLALLVVFSGTVLFAAFRIDAIREDLRLVHRGYISMARQATQLRTLQEAKEEYVRRALDEPDGAVRRHLIGYAREFYPRALRDRLRELRVLAVGVQAGEADAEGRNFLSEVHERIQRVQRLHDAYDDASVRLLTSIEEAPDAVAALDAPEDAPPEEAAPDEAAPEEPAPDPEAAPAVEGPDLDTLLQAYEETGGALSREVRALSLSLETRIAQSLLQAERAGREATFAAFALTAVGLVLGLLILFGTVRALRPLRLLLDSARAIRRGSLDVEVPADGRDEVGELGREFNEMARALRDRESALASRNDELVQLKHFSDDVIRSVRVGILILDESDQVRMLNPAARSVFALPLVDVQGRALTEMSGLAEPLREVIDRIAGVRAEGEVETFPLRKIGERIVDVGLVPVRDRAGASLSDVILLGEDVTEREHTRERLVQSERLAAIGRLAAQITHEIRNPLSSIGLNIELLGDDVAFLPEERRTEAREILGAVGREVSRLTQITEGYLRYARLPAPRRVAGDVGDLLADLCAFSQTEAEQEGVMLELNVDDDLPDVPFDSPRLRQALLNLLKNALEAAGRGGTVRCSAGRADDGGARVSIEDSGPGFSEDARARLFEPFFTTKAQGTGLGLTLTREIIAEHGGQIEVVDSSLGGAGLRITLPAEAPESEVSVPDAAE
jgi:PAS domain S-box-containing protein